MICKETLKDWNPDAEHCDADYDNHANQLNPNNDEYWHSRGLDDDDD